MATGRRFAGAYDPLHGVGVSLNMITVVTVLSEPDAGARFEYLLHARWVAMDSIITDPRLEVMVFFKAEGAHAKRKQAREMPVIDSWIAVGIFLFGAWVGALATVRLDVKQTHRLKERLEAAIHDKSQSKRTS
jgi:hypothetical protein